jgi:hypothetical protein
VNGYSLLQLQHLYHKFRIFLPLENTSLYSKDNHLQ